MRRDSYDTNGNLFAGDSLPEETVPVLLVRAWDRALRMLSQRVNKPTFETHLRGLVPLGMVEEISDRQQLVRRVTIGAPSAFTRSWVEGRHAGVIKECLEEIFDGAVILLVGLTPKEMATTGANSFAPNQTPPVAPPASPKPANPPRVPPTATRRAGDDADGFAPPPAGGGTATLALDVPVVAPKAKSAATVPAVAKSNNAAQGANKFAPAPDAPEINPRYTFDRFVVGPTNRLAHGGALAVASSPGQKYNPLFLYGPPGLGKTHLLHAIANTQLQKAAGSRPRVAYMSGEAFTAQYVTSLRQQRAEEFRRRLKSVDLLLVDDIQFIAGKEQTKEEFFHVFNTLAQTGKQIVICSDRSPRELTAMDERLQSRFESGLVADVAPPELETRLAILQNKAEGETLRVPDDVLLYMARLVQSNIRTLEGALVKLVAYASLTNSQVTTQMAEGILEKYFIAAGAGLAAGSTERGGAVGSSSLFVPDGKGFSGYGMNVGMTNGAEAARTPPRTVDRFAAPEKLPYVPKVMRPAPALPLAPPASAPAPSYAYTVPVAVAAPLAASGEKLSAELIFRVV
ncbi:MAG: chromosomal replication initiator protein DnaA, partial [Armatimonadetes bacterium]|nr:chromosomal replication initiator protein DnaA [Armatimonadota bacterium]